eukprot:maker-scaffold691_size110934-snap-gene-0.30 protein:Tk06099 transcript:maker-scaffold691_size110934-snap-gene-0.30-mRNA-1 annotation:"unnamed protein product"
MGISAICTWVITTAIVSVTARLKFDYRFTSSVGLFPSVFNLAEGADVFVNATCGQYESEVYCTLSGLDKQREQCGVCDGSKPDKAHHIELALDGEETWWQSPSLQYGSEYNFVTITVDLKKVAQIRLVWVFQVAYILIQSGPSPRPGNWILERSINGQQWAPWQFFALSDEECWHAFGLEPRKGKPRYEFDEEVICTSYFSGLEPKENGEIHISLVNGRPGASGPSQTLLDFTQARFIRVRLQRVRMTSRDQRTTFDFLDDMSLRRYFYSVRDITVGGQCPCNGHASECPVNQDTMLKSPDDPNSERIPGDDYYSGEISAVIILMGLTCDSLALAGFYERPRVNSEMLVPWIMFYTLLVPSLVVISFAIGLSTSGSPIQYGAFAPAILAMVYLVALVFVAKLYLRETKETSKTGNEHGLEPLTNKSGPHKLATHY